MTITNLLRTRATVTWLLLVAATVLSWAIGAEHGTGSMVAVVVLAIAAIKVRYVGLDFMELRHAPIPLRAAFECYCVGMWALLSGLYLWL
ncbi:cytochrome C oxidase subunit IV family protein [Mycolicibacterium pyrenivorans]|uniref:cytochrome C oxidase subunit IV family protein n=1 Tax=Mycolicibacterium pyrenivorans TaxID=187102 RepID=UPI0021F2EDF1|nr:cytochrome C oxidase subunit IV family protein [Mycolicibacterium pyrenivorans]MCV7150806.1 cytochrome C oxidase subunit IV family protein [Mycolicibacterium pyrenivorans]